MPHQPIRSSLGNHSPRLRRTLLGSLMLATLSLWLTEVATATDYTVSSFDVPFAGAGATGAFGISALMTAAKSSASTTLARKPQ